MPHTLPIAAPCRFASVTVRDRSPFDQDTGAGRYPPTDTRLRWLEFEGQPEPVEGLADLLPEFLALGAKRPPPAGSFLKFAQRFGPLGLDEEGFPAGRRSRFRWERRERMDHVQRAAHVAVALRRMACRVAEGALFSRGDYTLCRGFFRGLRQGASSWIKDRLEWLPDVRLPAWEREKARRKSEGHSFATVTGEEAEKEPDPMQAGFLAGALAWWVAGAGATIRVNVPWDGTAAAFAIKEGRPFSTLKGFEKIDLERKRVVTAQVSVEEGTPPVDIASTGLWLPLGLQLGFEVESLLRKDARHEPGRWEECGYCGQPFPVVGRRTRAGLTPCCKRPGCLKARNAAAQRRWYDRHRSKA